MNISSNRSVATNVPGGNVLTIQTVQVAPFKSLLSSLKDILIETNIDFRPDGMRIIDVDKSNTIVVHMHLPASGFELFQCTKDRIVIGVNIPSFFKTLSALDNDDTLTMYIPNSSYSDGIVSDLMLKFENDDKGSKVTIGMKLIDPEISETDYPDVQFSSIINIPSSELQKHVKQLMHWTDRVEIKSVGKEVIFSGKGERGKYEAVHRECADGTLTFVKHQGDSSKITQGEFSLKNLGYVIRCTSLCPQIEMYLENDLPLVVKYDVASLGEIKMCVAPLPSV